MQKSTLNIQNWSRFINIFNLIKWKGIFRKENVLIH